MPGKRQYERLKSDNRCPKCGDKLLDDTFVTCETCRKNSSKQNKKYAEHSEVRRSAMALFGIRRTH